jgi:uncharacterized protein with ATP-grasp and redox domains
MTISSLRKLPLDEKSIKALYSSILDCPALRGLKWDITSPEVVEDGWRKIVRAMGTPDPFALEKSNQNSQILGLYPGLKKMVNEDSEPLHAAVKLAILGNSLDFMVTDKSLNIESTIKDRMNVPLSKKSYSTFKQQLQASNRIIYFGDNSGEIVLDKLFIETIKSLYQPEIVYVVRSMATLNDATLAEAKSVGMDNIVKVIENGIDGPLPGTILSRCSNEVNEILHRSDLIISKGGGNYDTLDEERKRLKKKISFLLLSKCDPHFKSFSVDLYHPVLANFYKMSKE